MRPEESHKFGVMRCARRCSVIEYVAGKDLTCDEPVGAEYGYTSVHVLLCAQRAGISFGCAA
jgi:hypothetical protein